MCTECRKTPCAYIRESLYHVWEEEDAKEKNTLTESGLHGAKRGRSALVRTKTVTKADERLSPVRRHC